MFLNKIISSHIKLIVFCTICIALCGSNVTDAPNTETLTSATTGLEDIFSDVEKQSLSIKNISFETNDNDEYYLNWFFDNGNDEIESTIDVHVKNEGPVVFFRHIPKIDKSRFFKINIEKLEKCTSYNATLQAYNKLRDTEKYQYNFETSPLNIEDILENVTKNKTSITWTSPCSNFQVTMQKGRGFVEIFNLTNNTNRLDVNHALYCTSYSITALSANGSKIGTEINRKIVPGPVEDLKLTPLSTSIQVTWSPPEDDSCVTGYIIWRSDNNNEDFPAETTSYNFSGLNSCQMYNISVASISENEIGSYRTDISRTLAPTDGLSQVGELKFTDSETEGSINVEWSVLPEEERCIKQFSVTINSDPPFNHPETNYVITKPIACQTYTVSVVAMGIDDTILSSEPKTQEYTTKEEALNPPQISVNPESGLEINSIKFDIVIDPITVNACKLTSVEITCEAKSENDENDPNLPWVNSPVINDFSISTEETEFQLELTKLSTYTNYTCYGISKIGTLLSPRSTEVNATTILIGTAQKLVISEITSNSAKIEWISFVPEATFLIEIVGLGPIHYIPEDCKLEVADIVEQIPETTFEANGLLPSYDYKVSVKIISWLGTSEPTEITQVTLTEASEKIRDLDKKTEVTSIKNYTVTADVFWTYPCNTNGKISEFKIVIVETDKETSQANPSEDIVKVDPEPKLMYNYEMKLNPYSEYTITINAINEYAGLEETITFDSPDGLAEAPETEVLDTTSSGFNLKWLHPIANGVLMKYQVEINDLGPKFDIPQECEPQSTPQLIEELDKEITNFNYSDALAYHGYEIKVSAITEVSGLGKASKSIENTLGSEPTPIRDLLVKRIQSHSSDEFQADMHIEFKQSCNLAGVFFEYEIHIIGERVGFEKHDESYTIKDINGIDATMTPLRAEYNYTVTGRVKNDITASTDISYQFKAPSGVPGLSDSVNITAPDSKSFIAFLPSSFTNINGDVLYFAVLLSANYDFDDDYAYWESWPAVGQYSKGPGLIIEPYQITPVNWEPEKTEEAITYELGNQNCEDQAVLCNGVLREETKYTVTVRGFTEDGYRDIRTHFNMPSLARSISLGIILGITFGILFTGFIFIGSYLVYRRGMFRSTKPSENGRHSAINPHSTKDVCIVLPPEVYKKDDDVNARSFSTLQKASERNKGVTSVAEAEDNRKRNRYVNVLPFDSTRVVLNDGIESDYINASFIKGYSHQIEYIAAQGPLEGTVEDFWRMVAQEKVTTILMLTQLKEQNREKCFKYFPFNLENMRLNDINLYCCEEDVCKSYIQRNIVFDIGTDTFNIQHFQYTDWPDFNVPDGTETMIKFVKKIRKMKNQIGGVILVHCSAGVGRTGTLISIDILLQVIDDGQEYDIYQTVLDLRSQRVNMVQNEKQYLYIGSCMEDYVKSRRKSGVYNGTEEPIYANVKSRKY